MLKSKSWDDTATIGTLSIQKSTDTYRYGHHAAPIQVMVTAAKNNNDCRGTKTIRITVDFHAIEEKT